MSAVAFDLHYVDELIDQRRALHGGLPGAPPLVNGYRQGESLNRSCILMLSARLQTYVEDVFVRCSKELMPSLANDEEVYRKTFDRWGNPSPDNINKLFNRLGIKKVLSGLKWQKTPELRVASKLRSLNEIRNCIAHGKKELKVNGIIVNLSLYQVENYRNFCSVFCDRFEQHASYNTEP